MNDTFLEAIEYRGFNIEVHSDFDPINPIEEWDMLSTMVCWHSRYDLGHEQPNCDPDEYLQQLAIEADPSIEDKIDYWENGIGWKRLSIKYSDPEGYNQTTNAVSECERIIKSLIQNAIDKHYIMQSLYLYDHSGITISTSPFSCPWDSGQVGFVYISKEAIKKEFSRKHMSKNLRQKAIEIIQSEVNSYDQYLTGEIYGYCIERTDRNKSIDCDDSCWGFYGYDHEKSGLLEMAKDAIDYAIKEYREQCKQNHQRRMQMEHFMKNCWAA